MADQHICLFGVVPELLHRMVIGLICVPCYLGRCDVDQDPQCITDGRMIPSVSISMILGIGARLPGGCYQLCVQCYDHAQVAEAALLTTHRRH